MHYFANMYAICTISRLRKISTRLGTRLSVWHHQPCQNYLSPQQEIPSTSTAKENIIRLQSWGHVWKKKTLKLHLPLDMVGIWNMEICKWHGWQEIQPLTLLCMWYTVVTQGVPVRQTDAHVSLQDSVLQTCRCRCSNCSNTKETEEKEDDNCPDTDSEE